MDGFGSPHSPLPTSLILRYAYQKKMVQRELTSTLYLLEVNKIEFYLHSINSNEPGVITCSSIETCSRYPVLNSTQICHPELMV